MSSLRQNKFLEFGFNEITEAICTVIKIIQEDGNASKKNSWGQVGQNHMYLAYLGDLDVVVFTRKYSLKYNNRTGTTTMFGLLSYQDILSNV